MGIVCIVLLDSGIVNTPLIGFKDWYGLSKIEYSIVAPSNSTAGLRVTYIPSSVYFSVCVINDSSHYHLAIVFESFLSKLKNILSILVENEGIQE